MSYRAMVLVPPSTDGWQDYASVSSGRMSAAPICAIEEASTPVNTGLVNAQGVTIWNVPDSKPLGFVVLR